MTRGAFEFQGQKCSAASRAYVPASLWNAGLKEEFAAEVDSLTMGDVSDLSNFMSAVIDERSFAKNKAAIDRAKADPTVEVVAGGTYDDSEGYFVRPTVLVSTDPENEIFKDEYFGPILGVYVYEDAEYDAMLEQMESASAYGLTGCVIAQDRAAAAAHLREAALRGRQLLHQRQAHRRRRRPAALRWRPRVRHQRQGRRQAEPDALDLHPLHQGDAGAPDGLPLPAHGLTPVRGVARRSTARTAPGLSRPGAVRRVWSGSGPHGAAAPLEGGCSWGGRLR